MSYLFLEWESKYSKSYKNIQNHSKICPVCELGKVFIKGENSISARIPNFLRYINFHYENIETIQEEIDNLSFSSKRLFHFKCPTCHVGWKDVANTSKLINKHNQELVHVGVMKVHILYLTLKHTLIFGKFIFQGSKTM